MEDHIGHVTGPFLNWIATAGIGAVLAITAFWIKRWINMQDRQQEEWLRQGGLITRERFDALCLTQRSKCPAGSSFDALCDWRENIMEKGGPLTKGEHSALCKEITKEVGNHFTERVSELFDHHREWVAHELKIIQIEQTNLKSMVQRQMKTETKRWDEHDERRGMPTTDEGL